MLIFLIFVAIGGQFCFAEMDWKTFVLKEYATRQDQAFDLLKNELNTLQYDAVSTVGEFLLAHDREGSLTEHLHRYKMDQYYLTDGTTEYAFHLALTPSIMSLILPNKKTVQLVVPVLCPTCGQEWPSDKKHPAGTQLQPKEIETEKYTSIIVDCSGMNIAPCFFPRIYNEKLQEVYSIDFADSQHVTNGGLVKYTDSRLSDISNKSLIGENPLRIKALAIMGPHRTDIKISMADARRVHGSQSNIRMLRECRVVIISGQ
ncbi:MAG: hypothetical protein JSV98_01000 [candidate division WOR-3 bacterium]|nr:MAG: hypothetical protein JSV98_01000 [candidate division WOR-3 bacterium]